MEHTAASEKNLWNVWGIIINEVSGGKKYGGIFSQARLQMKQEKFSSLYICRFPLWSVLLQGSGSNYRVSNQSSEKRKPFPVELVSDQ